jgi:hypothetical protein
MPSNHTSGYEPLQFKWLARGQKEYNVCVKVSTVCCNLMQTWIWNVGSFRFLMSSALITDLDSQISI